MGKIDNILFPVDLSEASPNMVPCVKVMAEKFAARIHILFVARAFEHYSGMGVPYTYTADFTEELVKQAERKLKEFASEHFEGMDYQFHVARGYPAEEIVNAVSEREIDMVVIGTHGRKGLERIIFGSVAEHVVKYSPVPVLTVNPYRESEPAPLSS